MALKLADILARRAVTPPPEGPYGIGWIVIFRFSDGRWADRAFASALLEAGSRMPWWQELDRHGVGYRANQPLVDAGELLDVLVKPERSSIVFDRAAGGCEFELETLDATIEVRCRLEGEVLDRHGPAQLSGMIDLITGLRADPSRARVALANAYPFPGNRIDYPRPQQPRSTLWRADAVADIFDPDLTPGLDDPERIEQARRLARADVPREARREERAGVTIVRWVDDVTDREQMRAGLAAREAWLARHP